MDFPAFKPAKPVRIGPAINPIGAKTMLDHIKNIRQIIIAMVMTLVMSSAAVVVTKLL